MDRHVFRKTARALAAAALFVAAFPAAGQDLKAFEEKTTVHKLENGWTFVIVERPVAPVVAFVTLADVGSAQEVTGITGLAHMFEHMAFKGTPTIGTRDYPAEQKALGELEAAYQAYQQERLSVRRNQEELDRRLSEFRAKQAAAAQMVVPNELDDILTREGGINVNAATSADDTEYFLSVPANKVELWAFIESERFAHPVYREFYEERDVVQEERRMVLESQPIGRLFEQIVSVAFQSHPYHHRGIGHMSDLQSLTITDAESFFRTYYAPANLTTAIVGDVHAKELIPLLEKYFGRIPARPAPQPLRTVEPPQIAEKTVVVEDPSQPTYSESYHKPGVTHPDQEVYDAIDDILSNGRTSRLYRSLVRDKKLAVQVNSFDGFPGKKYPGLWIAIVVPAFGVTNEQVQSALRQELERLKTEDVTDAELARFRARTKAGLLRSLSSNEGLANQLVEYQVLFGDWRELFRTLERVDRVTKADIRRVANELFQKSNRTVGMIVTQPQQEEAKPAAPGAKR